MPANENRRVRLAVELFTRVSRTVLYAKTLKGPLHES